MTGTLPAILAVSSLSLALLLAGRALLLPLRTRDGDPAARWVLELVAGWLLLHGLLTVYDLVGIRWSRASVLPVLGVLAIAGAWAGVRPPKRGVYSKLDLGWGDGIALLAVLATALAALALWSANPDFVYHWGVKGHRFFLDGGIDRVWLGLPSNWPLHPGYPNLLPELFAVTGLVRGGFDEPAMLLWSAVFTLALALAARAALRTAGELRLIVQGGVALATLGVALGTVSLRLAGGPDVLLALALVLALPALLGPAGRGSEIVVIALATGLAACAKLEGALLAALILGAWWWRRSLGRGWRGLPAALPAVLLAVLPATVLAGPWWLEAAARGWLRPVGTGSPEAGHAIDVFRALGQALASPRWHGLAFLGLVVAVDALRRQRWRLAAVVGLLQLGAYAALYLTARQNPVFWVQSSFPRLLVHVVPAFLVLGVAAIGARLRENAESAENTEGSGDALRTP